MASGSDASRSEDTGYTPGEDSTTRWRNWFSLVTGQMTDEGKKQYRNDRDIRHEESDCKRCEKYRDHLLKYSKASIRSSRGKRAKNQGPIVRFMRENINKLGADINADNVYCQRCTVRKSGGFNPKFGIELCANEMRNQGHVEDTLAHGTLSVHLRARIDSVQR